MHSDATRRYLVLSNGAVFRGDAAGAAGTAEGELVFSTAMGGYLEALSDPSSAGQLLVQAFPSIGNYGFISEDLESNRPQVAGYIVRELCQTPSNMRTEASLDAWLKRHGIPVITGIDTRALVRLLRRSGPLTGRICDAPPAPQASGEFAGDEGAARSFANITAQVRSAPLTLLANDFIATPPSWLHLLPSSPWDLARCQAEGLRRVVVLDFGVKRGILRELLRRGVDVHVLPADSNPEQVMALEPQGLVLSNGPGDPAFYAIETVHIRALASTSLPILGIGLGHQLLARSQGFETRRLRFGHHGANQPVRALADDRIWMTSQAHDYIVLGASLDESRVALEQVNNNDGSCEALRYRQLPALSVQYQPEGSAGPQDAHEIFDRFFDLMQQVVKGQFHAS